VIGSRAKHWPAPVPANIWHDVPRADKGREREREGGGGGRGERWEKTGEDGRRREKESRALYCGYSLTRGDCAITVLRLFINSY
jgi:hypothetical protein